MKEKSFAGKLWTLLGGRKFLGFILSTALLWFGKVSDEIWCVAFIAYVGSNVAQKALLSVKGGGIGYAGQTEEILDSYTGVYRDGNNGTAEPTGQYENKEKG